MACDYPISGWRPREGTRIVFDSKQGWSDRPVTIPCGRCTGCRLEHSRQWAVRCVHESQMHQENSFITLTYNDDHLPKGGTLVKSDFQNFMKRLRKHYLPKGTKRKIRYYMCGEYGEKTLRPHYHACLFGLDFQDKKLWTTQNEHRVYTSQELSSLWSQDGESLGFSTIGQVTFQSAAYVARYIMKKITGDLAADHYRGRQPEYTTMSRRPGLAKTWIEKYHETDVSHDDHVILNGKTFRPPRYYDNHFEITDPEKWIATKARRITKGRLNPDNTPERRKVRAKVRAQKLKKLKRNLEND